MSPFVLLNYGICFTALLALRRKDPAPEGIFRVPLFPATTIIGLACSAVFLAGSLLAEPRLGASALLMVAVAFPLFRSLRRRTMPRGGGPPW
jgi:amino acid transporter